MVHIIRADAGCDKSKYLTELFAREAAAHPQLNYVYIVPEQFTLSTQSKMVKASPNLAIMNIDVLSFNRLAYRVFTELGVDYGDVLMETGKSLLIRRVAQEKENDLGPLKGNMKKPGYILQMKSLISELTQYKKTPEDIEELLSNDRILPSFKAKAHDLMVMYRGFLDAKKDRYITSEELLDRLLDVIDQSSIIQDAIIAFDGFTGFTPLQRALLDRMIPAAKDVYVTITIAKEEAFTERYDELSLFAMSRKMKLDLDRICQDHHLEEEICTVGDAYRIHVPNGYLDTLHRNLFREKNGLKKSISSNDEIHILRLDQPQNEVRYVAGEIRRLVRECSYRYQDIAVVSADPDRYGYLIREIFADAGINVFFDSVRPVLVNPSLEYLRSCMELALYDFSYEGVMKYLRSGLSKVTQEEADRFENYILAFGIRGSMYQKPFTYRSDRMETDRLDDMNAIRTAMLEELQDVLAFPKSATVQEYCRLTFLQLHHNQIEEQIRARAAEYEKLQNTEKAREYIAVYRSILEILEKMAEILQEEEVTLAEYNDLLEAGLAEVKLAVIPPDYDSVTVGDIERTRLEGIKVLFLLGATDDLIPKKENHGGLLSQMDRQMLFDNDVELSPTDRQRQAMQRFYLYMTLARPSERLYVTCTNVDMEGKAVMDSYLISTITELFSDVREELITDIDERSMSLSPAYIRYYMTDHLRSFLAGQTIPEHERILLSALCEEAEGADELGLQAILDRMLSARREETIDPNVIQQITGGLIQASSYQMESYSKCPYAYYLDYLLRLSERKVFEVSPADLGNLYHGALDLYCQSIHDSSYTWRSVPDDVSDQYLSDAIEDTMATFRIRGLDANPRERYLFDRAKKTLKKTVWMIKEQVKAGLFEPMHFELDFNEETTTQALCADFPEDYRIRFKGKVDRVDTYTDADTIYVKIVDYKSGNKSFSDAFILNGLQMQLIMYMDRTIRYVEKKNPGKTVLPGAIFYSHVEDPFLDESKDPAKEIYTALMPTGFYNTDLSVIRALDENAGQEGPYDSLYFHYRQTKEGSISGQITGAKSIIELNDYRNTVNQQIAKNVSGINHGHIEASPYRYGSDTACDDHCPYSSICRFEPDVEGCRYREISNRKESGSDDAK